MEHDLQLRIILERPPREVLYGLQKGSGRDYETVQKQMSKGNDLRFEFDVRVKENKDGSPNFLGSFAQGPASGRFIYLNIGTSAGQTNTPWSRRLKVPLRDIKWETLTKVTASQLLETRVTGTAPDGSPTCATVKPFSGWKVAVK